MTATFEVLADGSRRRILDLLIGGERPVGDLVDLLAVSQPTMSKHLKALRDAGLVESRTEGQRRIYRVRPEPLREIDEWLVPYRRGWAAAEPAAELAAGVGGVSALERHLQIVGDADAGL